MQADTNQASIPSPSALACLEKQDIKVGASFPPLEEVTRPTVDTAAAAHYLNRRPQTLRDWHCNGAYPDGLRPIRINGRLSWPVAAIRAVLGVSK